MAASPARPSISMPNPAEQPAAESIDAMGDLELAGAGKEASTQALDMQSHQPAQPEPRQKKTLAFHMSILSLIIMGLSVALDGTILAVAIPTIAEELNGTTLEAFWASISFLLAVVVVQPIYTNVSNVLGRLIPLYASFFLFCVGSVIFAVANNMTVLIAGRVVLGLGGGGLDVLNEVILADITTLKERPIYLGYMAVPVAAGAILGPIVGGLFAQYASWRWIGWSNLPIAAVNLVLVFFFMKLKQLDQSFREKLLRLDWVGLVMFAVGCTLLASPIAWAGAMYPWSSWRTILPLVLGVVTLAVFLWYESRPEEPLFPRRIFRSRTATFALLGAFLHGLMMYSLIYYAPLYFQAVFSDSPMQSAVSTLPMACVSVAFSIIGAITVEVVRKYHVIILVSWVLASVGIGLFTLWGDDASQATLVIYQIIWGIGSGNLFSILNLPLQASVHADDMGLAAGILVSFRLFGGLLGLSMCSTIFSTVFAARVDSMGPLPDELAILGDVREAVGLIPYWREADLPASLAREITGAYMDSLYAVFWMLSGACAVGFLFSLLLKEVSLESEELGRQQLESERRD